MLIQEPANLIAVDRDLIAAVTNIVDELLHFSIDVSNERTLTTRLSSRDGRSGDLEATVLELRVDLESRVRLLTSSRKGTGFSSKIDTSIASNVDRNDCNATIPVNCSFLKQFEDKDLVVNLFDHRSKVEFLENALERSKCSTGHFLSPKRLD